MLAKFINIVTYGVLGSTGRTKMLIKNGVPAGKMCENTQEKSPSPVSRPACKKPFQEFISANDVKLTNLSLDGYQQSMMKSVSRGSSSILNKGSVRFTSNPKMF